VDRPLTQTSMAKQSDLVDGLPLSRNQQIEQYEKKLANVRAKLEAKEPDLNAIRSLLTDAENQRMAGARAKQRRTHCAPRLLRVSSVRMRTEWCVGLRNVWEL
jgi:Spy/CpxP family protein refolding chaperone